MVDPVALLAAGAAAGLFSDRHANIQAHAQRLPDPEPGVSSWRLLLEEVDVGALRLLANMLACQPFDAAEIVADGRVDAAIVQPDMLSYPSYVTPREFAFVYEQPAKSRGGRGVRLNFADEPADEILDLVIASLDAWGNLIMAGAYSDGEARAAGILADQATLEEPSVVGISLEVHTEVDEAMFSPVVNLARRIHALHAPLERLEIL
jgi:hypothetical protein